ncbi:MAG: hypothetical protein FJY36_04865 [Betaproteobacteria bacterium]|nr:hypothetical protein [Betaproteobacteria bacterium]
MHWIARIFMGLLGLGLLAGLLLALGVYTLYATLRWLLTGHKPQVVLVWQQFSALRRGRGMRWGRAPGSEPSSYDNVVDVQAREVHEATPRLPDRKA